MYKSSIICGESRTKENSLSAISTKVQYPVETCVSAVAAATVAAAAGDAAASLSLVYKQWNNCCIVHFASVNSNAVA